MLTVELSVTEKEKHIEYRAVTCVRVCVGGGGGLLIYSK